MKKVIAGVIVLICVIAVIAAIRQGGKIEQSQMRGEAKIGVIYLEGPIMGGGGTGGLFSEHVGTDAIIRQIRKAGEDKEIRAVVLRMNTPGGSAAASQEVAEEITKLQKNGKIVVTSMGDVAASGGYWIAAGTDRIVANPATTTGSIGVIWSVANLEELYRKIGVHSETFKSGPYKDMGSPNRQMTSEEKALLQGMVNDIYEQFVAVVATGRKMDEANVRKLADGRIFTGRQAKELGLVDELGNLYDAIDIAAQLAQIEGKPKIKEFGKNTPWEKLWGEGPEENLRLLGQRWILSQPAFPGIIQDVPR